MHMNMNFHLYENGAMCKGIGTETHVIIEILTHMEREIVGYE